MCPEKTGSGRPRAHKLNGTPFDEHHRALTIGLVAVVTLVAIEALAVITVLPDIEDDLGGIVWYGWVTTAFFLGTMIGIVFAGDQADRRGAGRPYVIGLAMFAVGLVVCGAASSMAMLVLGRFVQGLGAGVVPAIGYVAIGRAYPATARPRMFAVLSTAWVVPGIIGPALSERVSAWVGWRWVFLGLLPFVLLAGSLIIPQMMRLTAPAPAMGARPPVLRRPVAEAVRAATGAAIVLAGFTASRWLLVPAMVAGALIAIPALRRLTPPGTLRGAPGVPAVVLSRGVLTLAFFGADTFVPYALTDGRGRSTFAGSVAVTVATLLWTTGAWVQERRIGRLGEPRFIRVGFAVLGPGISVVALTAASDELPFWLIHVGWAMCGLGIGLAYAAHSQAVLRCSPPERYGAATSSLSLTDNLGVALGTGIVGVVVTIGEDFGWDPGRSVGLALLGPIAATVIGVLLSSRLPGRPAPDVRAVGDESGARIG